MRTMETTLYQFEELSTEAREKAIESNATINIDFDWWDCTYESVKEMGITINSFDIYHRDISITIVDSDYTARQMVKKYGEGMEVFASSKQFIEDRDALVKRLGEGNDIDGYSVKDEFFEEFDEEIENLEEEYRKEMAENIFTWLEEEYFYLQSEESIAQALIDNEYEFTKDGKKW